MTNAPNTPGGRAGRPAFFLTFSRNNDPNGNPYRLLIGYGFDHNGELAPMRLIEARSSTPNAARELRADGYQELGTWHLAPKEYTHTKREIGERLKLEHSH